MFRLNDPLKSEVEIDGVIYKLNLSYDNVLDILESNSDTTLSQLSKLEIILTLLLSQNIDYSALEDAFVNGNRTLTFSVETGRGIWEETCTLLGLIEEKPKDLKGEVVPMPGGSDSPTYDLGHDAPYIFSGFLQTYGVDLIEQQAELDYRKFMAMLEGLPSDTMFKQVIDIRTRPMPTGRGTEKERANLRKLKEAYALPGKEGD